MKKQYHLYKITILSCFFLCLSGWSFQAAFASNHPFFSKHPQQEKKLEKLLQALQFEVSEPQSLDLSIELQNVEGNKKSLEMLQGKVFLLTKWATWCGACRAELPRKLALKKQLADSRFALVGISSESQSTVAEYQKNADAKYPLSFIDSDGTISDLFPGRAIPVTLLVDAWGWVLGVKKGGARWASSPSRNLFKYLLSIAPSQKELQKKQQENVPAPGVMFEANQEIKTHQEKEISFTFRWLGESDKYSRLSLQWKPIKHIQFLGMRTSSLNNVQKGNQRQYYIKLKATKPGKYKLKGLKLSYWLKDYDKKFEKNLPELTLKVTEVKASLQKKQPPWLWFILGSLVLFGLVIILALAKKKKKASSITPATSVERQEEQLQKLLNNAIDRLVDYKQRKEQLAFLEEIIWIRKEVLHEEPDTLEQLGEKMRYAGHSLKNEELNQYLNALRKDLRKVYEEEADRLPHYK